MIPTALAAFIGCFAAFLVMSEVSIANRLIKYFVALVVGVIATFVLGWVVEWVAHIFARVG